MGQRTFTVRLCQTGKPKAAWSPYPHLLPPALRISWPTLAVPPSESPPELLSCLTRGKQMNWQRRGSGCQAEGTEDLSLYCICPLVIYRAYIIPSGSPWVMVHGPLGRDLQKIASIAISLLVHIIPNEGPPEIFFECTFVFSVAKIRLSQLYTNTNRLM